jgi:hypothetical protein
MILPIIIFLMGLSPLFVPVGVTVVDEFEKWRSRRVARPVRHFHPVPQSHPAVDLLPAAA